jgi:methionyl-tRNA synthetase
MSTPILVAVAWPYANSQIHVGNLTGSYLPADIYARFHRLLGDQVLMVSGTDAHGTPVMVRADAENTTPQEVYQRFHEGFIDLFQQLGLSYDLFTSTHTANHFKVSQDIFRALYQNGCVYPESQQQWFSLAQNRFLPDRYIEGTCYLCGYPNARGDQCDGCGSLLDATRLIDPRSKIDGSTPELRATEHFYLDLAKLEPAVVDFLRSRESYWRPNVMRQSLGQILAEPLHGRAITRDLEWGIPVPLAGWDGKSLYVWFEAVIGYLSAAIEWAELSGGDWRRWWTDDEARTYYFIGKDNIPFHAVIWPAQLIGAGTAFGEIFEGRSDDALNLPFDVPANEFMNMEGQKISGSRNWAVWGLDFLTRFDPDALRYYLTVNMPESKDTDWDWDDFVRRNNSELVATWGNLANRVLSFCYKHWEGHVPDPGELRPQDEAVLETIATGFEVVADHYNAVRLRAALGEALRLATEVNRYLDACAPWSEVKTDKAAAAKTIFTALRCIDALKVMFAPILPFTSERLHQFLGYDAPLFGEQYTETVSDELGDHTVLRYRPVPLASGWQPSELAPGAALRQPAPLFRKLDEAVAAEERARMGAV